MAGELDGGLPIVRDGILNGLIPAPDLEYALDQLDGEDGALCLMSPNDKWRDQPLGSRGHGERDYYAVDSVDDMEAATAKSGARHDPTDLTPFIDPAPVSLDICSPMDLVFECFVKLGLRYICVLRDGQFAGMVHKKGFVHYIKELQEQKR